MRYLYRASTSKPLDLQRGCERSVAVRRAAIDRSRGADMKVWRRPACVGPAEWSDASKPPVTPARMQRDIDRIECREIARALKKGN